MLLVSTDGLAALHGPDVERGSRMFGMCAGCHSLTAGVIRLGPSLAGVIGAVVAIIAQPDSDDDQDEARVYTDADYDRHVEAVRRKLPHGDFTILIEKPFVVIGDEAPEQVAKSKKSYTGTLHFLSRNRADARPLCDRVAKSLKAKDLAGTCIVLKLKTSDFQTLTRNHTLTSATQRADVIYRIIEKLVEREADGRRFRLIGAGVSEIVPGIEADPPDFFEL